MVNQTGHIDQIKQLNTGIVYRVIDQHGPISRISLSKQAQLAPASITKITRELMDAHLIKELEFPVLGLRGRPAVGLVIESEGWQFLSIRIKNNTVTLSLNEINSQTLVQDEFQFEAEDNHRFCELLFELISQFFAQHQSTLERVTAISILLDGIVAPHLGMIYKLPNYHVADLAIGQYLTDKTGLPVYLHDTVTALARADHFLHYRQRSTQNIIYLQIQDTVSAAIFNHGSSIDYISQQPILFSHTRIDIHANNSCYCGGSGCLETLISIPAILSQAKTLLADFPQSQLTDDAISIENICLKAKQNDELCNVLIKQVAEHMSKPLATAINLFGTELILINSPFNDASQIFFTELQYYISPLVSPLYRSRLQVEASSLSIKESENSLIQQSLYDGSLLLQLLQG